MKLPACLTLALLPAFAIHTQDDPEPEPPKALESFAMAALRETRAKADRAYLPFLDRSTLSCGLYHLKAGGLDRQAPHSRDEVYYVLNGKAKFTAGGETIDVVEGQVIFVAAKTEHRYHDIEEDLDLLVFFAAASPEKDER